MSGLGDRQMLLKDDEYSIKNKSISEDADGSESLQQQRQIAKAKALSMMFMKSFSGLCCDDCNCDNDPFKHAINNDSTESLEDDFHISNGNEISFLEKPATISPLVVEPMIAKNLNHKQPGNVETIVGEYMCFCRFYKVDYNSGILTALRFSSPSLRPSGSFHDTDMLALVEMLLRNANGALKHVTRLDFSVTGKQGRHKRNNKLIGFTSHGALSLAKALQTTIYIRQVFLPRNQIGPYGASALFMACRMNPTIEDLNLKRCRIGRRGALAFCEIILLGMKKLSPPSQEVDDDLGTRTAARGLVNVNLSLNHIGHHGTTTIENLLNESNASEETFQMNVNLNGNLVFPEIMNAVTHCMGVFLSLLGGRLLSLEVRDTTYTHRISCAIYTGSLVSLYLSSTLFHSFFAMVNTRHVFRVMDKCAIYILIAGSYTPFMQILLSDQPIYSFGLLGFIWVCCILGISVEASYPSWKHKTMFSLSMYLGMGWSCLVCLPQLVQRLHAPCVYLILLGGVAYTAGVPFFVRNNNLDHAIWHLFVMAGSVLHWIAIYFYVASTPLHKSPLHE